MYNELAKECKRVYSGLVEIRECERNDIKQIEDSIKELDSLETGEGYNVIEIDLNKLHEALDNDISTIDKIKLAKINDLVNQAIEKTIKEL